MLLAYQSDALFSVMNETQNFVLRFAISSVLRLAVAVFGPLAPNCRKDSHRGSYPSLPNLSHALLTSTLFNRREGTQKHEKNMKTVSSTLTSQATVYQHQWDYKRKLPVKHDLVILSDGIRITMFPHSLLLVCSKARTIYYQHSRFDLGDVAFVRTIHAMIDSAPSRRLALQSSQSVRTQLIRSSACWYGCRSDPTFFIRHLEWRLAYVRWLLSVLGSSNTSSSI